MKLTILLPVAILSTAVAVSSQTGQSPSPTILFEGARLIVGDGSAAIEDSAFVVSGNRFAAIGKRGAVALPAGASRVNLSGKTVMPALIDMHTHPGYVDQEDTTATEVYSRERVIDHLRRNAYYGVGTIMSLGVDKGDVPFDLRAHPVSGAAFLRTAGRGLAVPDGGANTMARRDAPYAITSEADIRKAIEDLAPRKPDLVKFWVDDRGGRVPKLSPELYRVIIQEAHAHGLRTIVHSGPLKDAKELLRAGVDGFAHSVRDDIDDEFVQMVKQRPEVFQIPNLPDRGNVEDFTWLKGTVPPAELQRMSDAQAKRTPEEIRRLQEGFAIATRNLTRLKAAGMKIGFGTDGNGGGSPAHVELADMVATGMTPAEVIVAATRTSAELLRLPDQGTIQSGKLADFIVLDANPLDDILNTRRISRVYLRGEEVDRTGLSRGWVAGTSR